MRRAAAALLLLLPPALAGCGGDAGGAVAEEQLTVLAAASLTEVLPRIDARPRYSFGASNALARQLREGAPADVIASADPRHTRALFRDGLVEEPVVFARNALVLVVPAANPAEVQAPEDLRRDAVRLVVAGNEVPAGAYTRELLGRLALDDVLDRAVSREPDVKGVLGKVALGEADAGFVYATDARAAGERVRTVELPEHAQPAIEYELAVVAGGARVEAARAFVRRVVGENGSRALANAGFALPR